MYREKVENRAKIFYIIVAMILAYAIVMGVLSKFDIAYKSVIQLAFLFILAIGVYMCMRFSITKYEYIITQNDGKTLFAVVSHLGSAEKLIANVSADNILCIAPYGAKVLEENKEAYRYNARMFLDKKRAYVMVFTDEKAKISKIAFNPSEKLIKEFEKFENIKVLKK